MSAVSATSAWAIGYTRDAGGADWAAGGYLDDAGATHSLLEHWDGSGWSVAAGVAPDVLVGRVDAGPDGTVWVSGLGNDGAAVAEPVTGVPYAEFAVNMLGRNLREAGLWNGPAGNLSVASGTSPSLAFSSTGIIKAAWTAANNHLWTVDSAGHRTDTMRLVAAGSGPAIAVHVGSTDFEVAYAAAGDGTLWLMAPDGTFAQAAGPVTIAAGTNPAIAALSRGGFAVAVHAAGSDHLVTVGPGGTVSDSGVTLAAGSSPALAPLGDGEFEAAAHEAGSDQLVTIGPSRVVRGSSITLAAGRARRSRRPT